MRPAVPPRRQPGPFGFLRTESRLFNELARPLSGAPLCGLNWAERIRRRGTRSVEFSGNRPVHAQPPLACKRRRGTSSSRSWTSTSKSGRVRAGRCCVVRCRPLEQAEQHRPRMMPREPKLVVLAAAARDEAEDAGREGLCRRRVLLSFNEPLRPAVFLLPGHEGRNSLRLPFGSGPVADGTDCDTPHQIPFPLPRLPRPDMSMVRPTRQGGPSESCCTHPLHIGTDTCAGSGPEGCVSGVRGLRILPGRWPLPGAPGSARWHLPGC